jgi:hypothetical protein
MDYSSGSLINIPRYQSSEQLEQKKVAFDAKMVISTTPVVVMICSFAGRMWPVGHSLETLVLEQHFFEEISKVTTNHMN